jgi:hypothetical protein
VNARQITRLAAVVAVLGTAVGCGYGLVGRTSSLPPDIETIFIEPLVNRTSRELIDQEFTRAISEEFLRRPRYEVVNSPNEADAVLTGQITSFNVRPVLFGGAEGRATEYEIQVLAAMEFKRADTFEVLWNQPYYQFRQNYTFDLDATFINREDQAVLEVADEFAQTLVIDLLEGF